MNPTFRKVALIAATLGLLLSLFLALRPDDDDETAAPATTAAQTTTASTTTEQTTTEQATTEETETEPPPPTTTAPPPEPAFDTIRVRIVNGQPQGGVVRATVEQGRDVVLVVRSDVADHVHLHGYDLMVDVAPGTPARLRFTADVPGRFEAELEDRGVHIADLTVRP